MRLAALLLALAGCQKLDAPLELGELDRPYFDCKVTPVLTKYCSALRCHGDEGRFFHIFARNRTRLDTDETKRNAFMSRAERDHNYTAAIAVIDKDAPEASQLLRKPLEQIAGGSFHIGGTIYLNGNVFQTDTDPDYQVLAQWLAGATDQPTCVEPGSNL